jgi:hypothetical protein
MKPVHLTNLFNAPCHLREVMRVKPVLHVCGHVRKTIGLEGVDGNAVQWGYDRINLGKGNAGVFAIMLGAWVGMWVGWVVGWRRTGKEYIC